MSERKRNENRRGRDYRKPVRLMGGGEMITKQAPARDLDAQTIVERFQQTGQLPPPRPGWFGDVSSYYDFHAALNLVGQVEDYFATLPAKLRLALKNDPGELLDVLGNAQRHAEAVALGLLTEEGLVPSSAENVPPGGSQSGLATSPEGLVAPAASSPAPKPGGPESGGPS